MFLNNLYKISINQISIKDNSKLTPFMFNYRSINETPNKTRLLNLVSRLQNLTNTK